jgi:hypothetical protein
MIGEVLSPLCHFSGLLPHIISDAAEHFIRNVGSQFELEVQIHNSQFP